MWSVYHAGRIGAFCIWYVRLDFEYNCDVNILMFNHAEWRINKWHATMTSHTQHGISTHWQLYCLLNSSFTQTWREAPSQLFMRGIHRRWNHHQITTPVIPCEGNPMATSGFTAHRASNIINYRMKNYITVTYEFHELRLTCISTVCSTARLDKYESRHQIFASFVKRVHLEQIKTPHTGPAMWKHLIKHWRSTSNAKCIKQTTKFRITDRL